ncbi:MAG: polysaccharide export protein [Gemmatimonadetes bacterium]|nr:polysaccharide export protein [Gemmatimonadota bacterium]
MMHCVERGRIGALVALAVLLTVAAPVRAQSEYTIGVGDVLSVKVWQRQDLSAQVTVDHEGSVNLPLVGAIRAVGQTPERLGEELTRRFSFVDRQVSQVTVTVEEFRSRRIYLMGQVRQPGTYSYPDIPSVWEIIREAGGPLPDAALTRIQVIPPEGEGRPVTVDLDRALATGDYSQLPKLVPGSTIMVPRLEAAGPEGDFIYVYGSVKKPGIVSMDAAGTVLGAVLAAGGPTPDANLNIVKVVRPGPVRARVFEVRLEDYTHDGVLFPNLELRPGDTVTVPKDEKSAFFAGLSGTLKTISNVAGTILFFWRLGDDGNNNNRTTVVVSDGNNNTADAVDADPPVDDSDTGR